MKTIHELSKKALSMLLSLTLLFPVKSSAADIMNQVAVSPIVNAEKGLEINNDDESDISLTKVLVSIFSCFAVSLLGLEVKEELQYRNEIGRLSKDFSEHFKNSATTCKLTKRQEGRMWCWLACLQGLLRYHNIEKSQKEIFKGISKSWFVSEFEHNRNAGLSIYSSKENMKNAGKIEESECDLKNTIFPSMIKEYVERVSEGRLTYQILYINKHLSNEGIKQTILSIYNKIGKRPFSLLANHTSCGHFINIVKIDGNGTMYIEDPAFQKGRKESIDNYVRNFDANVAEMVNGANGIMLGFVTEKNNMISGSSNHYHRLNIENYRAADSI